MALVVCMRKLLSIFLIYLFFFPLVAQPVVASHNSAEGFFEQQQTPALSPQVAPPPSTPQVPGQSGATQLGTTSTTGAQTAGGQLPLDAKQLVCDSSELSPQETQNIIDLLKKGFTVDGNKGITGITGKDTDRPKLGRDDIVLQDYVEENKAAKAKIPNQKMRPQEVAQFLNTYVKGPFAFGVVLEDSLRAGRCKDTSSPDCGLVGANLRYRNSGEGIVADLKPVKEFFGETFSLWTDKNKSKQQFSREENEVLNAALASDSNGDDTKVKTAKRLEKELIPNSILTSAFEAKLATNCTSSACVISTYSLFDKYFNSWMSSEMVVSSFGPSALFYTKKLFGWTGRRGFFAGLTEDYQNFLDLFRKKLVSRNSFLENYYKKRLHTRIDRYGWREWWMKDLISGNPDGTGYNLLKTEEFQQVWGRVSGPEGPLSRIKSLEERAEFVRTLHDLRNIVRAGQSRVKEKEQAWVLAEKLYGADHPVTKKKIVEYGQEYAYYLTHTLDDTLGLDAPEYLVRNHNAGFWNKGLRQIYPDGTSEVIDMYREHRNFQRLLLKFRDDGGFRNYEKELATRETVYESSGDNLVYYVFDSDAVQRQRPLSYGNIKPAANNRAKTFIRDDYGNYIPYSQTSVQLIQGRLTSGAQVFEGDWKVGGAFTPADFTARMSNTRSRIYMITMPPMNIEQMLNTLKERNWVSRRYWNALDKLAAQEDELIKAYFSIKGGAKWTAIPFAYWWAKKGFGIEDISQYQLPDTWHDIKVYHGAQQVYDYSFIDFFANEGSDQGDIFVQVLNKLPWKIVLDKVSDEFNPAKNLYNALTKNELRSKAEDLAFYLTGPEECVNCSMVIRTPDLKEFKPFFFVENQKLVSYILEDTRTDEAKEKGQTIIAFARRSNLSGKSGNSEGKKIDLVQAINGKNSQKTCKKAVEDLQFYGVNIGKLVPEQLKEKGRIGGVLAGLESISYAAFLWAGIYSSVAIQVSIAPQLHDCIDADEGYYVHYFMPAKEKKEKQASASEKSTEKVQKLVKNAKEKLFEQFKGENASFTKEAQEQLGKELDKFVEDSAENDIVQATLRLDGLSSGQLESRQLFYFWCGKGCEINAANYRTIGKEELKGVNDVNVGIDFATGKITANGQVIVDKPDNVRLASTNLNVPAVEIPHTVTETCLENSTERVIEINARGDVTVLNPFLLDCIKNGVLGQTGLSLDSPRLNDAFGKLEAVVTTTHPNVKAFGDKIIAEGIPRKVAVGSSATITIYANKDVNLSNSNDGQTVIGKLESIQFANGVIAVKPNGCFLTWLRHHEDGILSKDLVKGLKTKLERQFNEETQCEEPAISLEIVPDLGSDFKVAKADKFNKALKHQGPFTVFETPTKRYVVSAEKDENGECRDHLRVIDKETGKVEDFVGKITQMPDGLKIRTDDGKEHELKFSAKDGAPFVQLDANKPELLTSAQGKNGAFYYDPERGLWFAENANLLPLIEAFRQGIAAKVGPNGEVNASAQGNVLNLQVGKEDSNFLNLASLPPNALVLAVFVVLLVLSFVWARKEKKVKLR